MIQAIAPLLKKALLVLGLITGAALALQYAESRGYERRDAEVRLAQAQTETRLMDTYVENMADAALRNEALRNELDTLKQNAAVRIRSLTDHLNQQAKTYQEKRHDAPTFSNTQTGPTDQLDPPLLGACVLDAFTVRVLNDARANRPAEESGSGTDRDDEKVRATAVTGADLAASDLEVARLYHELAGRHDGLVDWVNRQCVEPVNVPTKP